MSMCRRVKCIKPQGGDTPTNKHAQHQTKAPAGRHNGLLDVNCLFLYSKKQHRYNLTNMPLNDVSSDAPVHKYVPGGNPSIEISVWPEVSKN